MDGDLELLRGQPGPMLHDTARLRLDVHVEPYCIWVLCHKAHKYSDDMQSILQYHAWA